MEFPFELNLRIDWSEMDLFGHVNNVMYFKYIQASRVNYWEKSGIQRLYNEKKIGPILASTTCQFKKPIHYPGNIIIKARVEFIKNSSFGIHHQILNNDNLVAAEANDVIVLYDFNKKAKVNFPADLRKKIEDIEKKNFIS